ncbi:MAG TPA: type 4a pilus biogenesis protein PilO [Bryobacteraceae bacterium]|nr:type 4a pilus biogenesis protein PilO [Bryobacteraceae bacterium]
MPRNFDLRAHMKDRRTRVRIGLGVLLVANLAAAAVAFHPFGGSPEDLARELESKQFQLTQNLQHLKHTRDLVGKVEQAKLEGDKFLDQYTMKRRTAFSTLIGEVNRMAVDSGMKPKESSYGLEAVTGSDTIEQLTISSNYEGSYASLTKFVNMLDRSPRFLIIESMQATPQPSGVLGVNVKLDTFVREAGKS